MDSFPNRYRNEDGIMKDIDIESVATANTGPLWLRDDTSVMEESMGENTLCEDDPPVPVAGSLEDIRRRFRVNALTALTISPMQCKNMSAYVLIITSMSTYIKTFLEFVTKDIIAI